MLSGAGVAKCVGVCEVCASKGRENGERELGSIDLKGPCSKKRRCEQSLQALRAVTMVDG